MSQPYIPDPAKIAARDKDVPWYVEDVGKKLGDTGRELFEKYSKIPADEVEAHIQKVVSAKYNYWRNSLMYVQRDEAWEVWPYPCIGGFSRCILFSLQICI